MYVHGLSVGAKTLRPLKYNILTTNLVAVAVATKKPVLSSS